MISLRTQVAPIGEPGIDIKSISVVELIVWSVEDPKGGGFGCGLSWRCFALLRSTSSIIFGDYLAEVLPSFARQSTTDAAVGGTVVGGTAVGGTAGGGIGVAAQVQ